MLDRYCCPQPPDHSIVQLRVATYGKQVAPIRGLESTASRIYFLCCASLLFEALECFLLRSWFSRLLRHPARRAEWAYSYLLPGPTRARCALKNAQTCSQLKCVIRTDHAVSYLLDHTAFQPDTSE